jgi:hypothetical protein
MAVSSDFAKSRAVRFDGEIRNRGEAGEKFSICPGVA